MNVLGLNVIRRLMVFVRDSPAPRDIPMGLAVRGEEHDHTWAEETFFDNVIMRGCLHCPAIVRVPPVPVDDPDALEAWLSS